MSPRERAESDGFWDGRSNRQSPKKDFKTGKEYIAWFKGWKRGQQYLNRCSVSNMLKKPVGSAQPTPSELANHIVRKSQGESLKISVDVPSRLL